MDFRFNDDQQAIQDAASRVFSELCGDDVIKQLCNEPLSMHAALWQQLADSGMLGLVIAEEHGGMGMSLLELCLVLEQQGRTLAPVPLLSNLVECAMTLAEGDNSSLCRELLPQVVSGKCILAPVRRYTGLQEASPLSLRSDAGTWLLDGRSGFSPYCHHATGFLLELTDEVGIPHLFYLDRAAPGITVVAQKAINDEAAGFVQFDQVRLGPEHLIASADCAAALLRTQQQRTWIALAALQTGILNEGLRRTATYVSERKQFGRALGAFQAVSQRAADAYMEIECLRSAYWRALDDIEQGNDATLSAAVAKYWVGKAGHHAGHTVLHLHGGIGQDLDYPIHRYFLWAKQCERYRGTPGELAAIVGDIVVGNQDSALGAL